MGGCVGVVQRDVGSWVFVFGIIFIMLLRVNLWKVNANCWMDGFGI